MCGDLILGMINPTSLISRVPELLDSRCNEYVLDPELVRMKKFYLYSDTEKEKYFNSIIGYSLSHDTDFALGKNPIQLICSDSSMLSWISQRFYDLHRREVINGVCKAINSPYKDFVENYASNLTVWQSAFNFSRQFDISNVQSKVFVDEVCEYFDVVDNNHARKIHNNWLENNLVGK